MALGNVFIKDVDGNIPYDTISSSNLDSSSSSNALKQKCFGAFFCQCCNRSKTASRCPVQGQREAVVFYMFCYPRKP